MKSGTAEHYKKRRRVQPCKRRRALRRSLFFGGFLHDEARLDAVVPEAAQRVFIDPLAARDDRDRRRAADIGACEHAAETVFHRQQLDGGKHGAARRRGARGAARQRRRGQDWRAALHGAQRALEAAEIFGHGARGEHRNEVVGVVKFKEDVRFAQPCGKRVARIAERFRRECQLRPFVAAQREAVRFKPCLECVRALRRLGKPRAVIAGQNAVHRVERLQNQVGRAGRSENSQRVFGLLEQRGRGAF